MKRLSAHILQDIDYYLTIRDYAVNKPLVDTVKDEAMIRLIFDKLYQLQKELREYKEYNDFSWNKYQWRESK